MGAMRRLLPTVIQPGWEAGRTSLRRKQMECALAGNVIMQIWLGKQYLGQADKVENENVNVNIEQCDDATLIERGRSLLARRCACAR